MRREIASMAWVKANTKVPVPEIYAWNTKTALKDNPLGKPWFIMSKVEGKSYMEMCAESEKKGFKGLERSEGVLKVLDQFAQLNLELLKCPFADRGALDLCLRHRTWQSSTAQIQRNKKTRTKLEPKVELFYCEDEQDYTEELKDKLKELKKEMENDRKNGNDPPDMSRADYEKEKKVLNRVQRLIPKLMVAELNEGPFFLCHGDTHEDNFMVDEEFNITGIIDWEHAHTEPLQKVCASPLWIDDNWNSFNRRINDSTNQSKPMQRDSISSWCEGLKEFYLFRSYFRQKISESQGVQQQSKKNKSSNELLIEPRLVSFMYERYELMMLLLTLLDHHQPRKMSTAKARKLYFEYLDMKFSGADLV